MLEKLINGTPQEEDHETPTGQRTTTVTEETVINFSYNSVCEVKKVEVLDIEWEPIENGHHRP